MTFASSTAPVCAARDQVEVAPAATWTAKVESTSPLNDRTQNGTTSAATDRRPRRPHTQRRFSSNDGTVPTAVATTLDHPAGAANPPTSTPSTTRLVVVDTSDTTP
jgi:hypothetical protein